MPTVQTPVALAAYPSDMEGVWSFPWGLVFDKAILDPQTLRFQLQVDTFPTFSSKNLIDVYSNSATIVSFSNGPLGKAIALQLPKRQTGVTSTWYWRMRINGYGYAGTYVSDWSLPAILIVPQDQTISQASALFADLADAFSYSKEANSSNIYKIFEMIGRELDSTLLEANYTQRDLSLEQSRDSANQNNFSDLVELSQVATEPNSSFRWKTRELFKSFLDDPGVITGIKRVVEAFVGEPPGVLDVTNTIGWILPINFIKSPSHPEVQPTIILFSATSKGFKWTLQIFNSWNLTFDKSVLESYVNRIKPAHTKVIFNYPTERHAQIRLNTVADWTSCVLTNLTTNSAGGLTLVGGQASGTAVTPVFNVPNLNIWDVLELDQSTVGQTIKIELRSCATQSGVYSSYETLAVGAAPISTPLQPFIQLQITISTSILANQPILNALRLNMLHT